MNPLLLGGIVESVGKIAGDLFTSDRERLDAEIELRKQEIEAQKVDASIAIGQMEVNKVEAASSNLFVSGWRPACGWIGAVAMAYQFVLYPLLLWGWYWLQSRGVVPDGAKPPPMLDTDALWVILTGMLGIAGARTMEKIKGVAK